MKIRRSLTRQQMLGLILVMAVASVAALALVPGLTRVIHARGATAGAPQGQKKQRVEDETAGDRDEGRKVVRIATGPARQSAPVSRQADAFGITPPIRDLPEFRVAPKFKGQPKIADNENNEIELERQITGWDKSTEDELAARSRATNKTNAPLAMPTPSLTFEGIKSNDVFTSLGTTSMPPDTVGDVGPNHYVMSANIGVFRIYDKNGTALNANTRIRTLFSSLPANNKCSQVDDGDPVVLYDSLADRWIISEFGLTGRSGEAWAPSYECIAVSQTGDPTGAYYAYGFRSPNDFFLDYPHLGVWTDGYYMSTHMFNSPGTAYVEGGFWAFNRAKMLAGDSTANLIYIGRSTSGGHLPADLDGNVAPPAGTPAMFFEYSADEFGDVDSLLGYDFVPDFNNPANSTLTPKPAVLTAAFDPRAPSSRNVIEQPSPATSTQYVDAISDRLMQRIGYRNLGTAAAPVNSYVMNWTVNVSGSTPSTASTHQAGVRWTEMHRDAVGTLSIFDQGTHAPDPASGTGRNRWMGSIAQDYLGNLALGFSLSGSAAGNFPGMAWAGRSGGDVAAGTMNEGEATVFAGTGVQQTTNGRWGDYSAMSIDPSDDCTFWFASEYRDATYNGTGNNPFFWNTRVGKGKFPTCTAAPFGQIGVTVTECSTGTPINGASVSVSPGGFFRLTKTDNSGTLASNITLAPDTYMVTASYKGHSASNSSVTVANGGTTNISLCLGGPIMAATTSALQAESCSGSNTTVDPGETVTVALTVKNEAGATTTNLKGALQTGGGVLLAGTAQTFGAVASGGTATQNFTFTTDPSLRCGQNIVLTLALTDGASDLGTVNYTLPASTTLGTPTTFSYAGPTVAIPDNNVNPATATLPVSGLTSNIAKVVFRFDGTAATTAGAGLDHSFVGNLTVNLQSPGGTSDTLVGRINTNSGTASGCNNDHFFNISLDDDATGGFINVGCVNTTTTSTLASGTYKPDSYLSQFKDENPNGNWALRVFDSAASNTGNIRAFSLIITPYSCCQIRQWTGAVSTDWNNPANWNPSGVPAASESVLVPPTGVTNEPTIGTGVTIGSLALASNRTLTVGSGGTLGVANPALTLLKGSVVYAGTATQLAPNVNYANVTINNPAGVSAGGNIAIDGTLSFSNGVLDTGGNTVTVSNCDPSAVTGGSSSSFVRGALQRCVQSGGSYNFPVGTSGAYSPLLVNATSGNTNFTVNPGTGPVTGSLSTSLNRTWALTSSAAAGTFVANLGFTYTAGDLTGYMGALPIDRAIRNNSGSFNAFPGTLVGTTLTVTGINAFSNWGLGGNNVPTASGVTVSGQVRTEEGRPVAEAGVVISDGQGGIQKVTTDKLGRYQFSGVEAGRTYLFEVRHRRYQFAPRYVFIGANLDGLNFTPVSP